MSTQLLERPVITDPSGPLAPPPLRHATGLGGNRYHIGRSWLGPANHEEGCPCHKAECGLVDEVDEFCTEHSALFAEATTMKSRHHERDCKGATHFPVKLLS